MKDEGMRTLTPRLRFPEFRDNRGWERKRLSDITSAVFDGTHQTPTYVEEGVPFYSVENLVSSTANKFISKDDYVAATKKNRPEKGDVLLTRIGKIGFSQVVTWEHEFSVYVTLAVIKQSDCFHSNFLHCFMQSYFYQSELQRKSLLNAVPCKINMDSLRGTEVLLADLKEQQRIADCLSSLDDLIAAEGQKLEALRDYKKGLMQQFFPAPGETQPRLRFPEFRGKGAWVKQPISRLLAKHSVSTQVHEHAKYREIGVRSHGKGIFHKEPKSGKNIGEKRVFQVIPNALVFNIVFAWELAVAVTSDKDEGFIASHRFPMYLPKSGLCDVSFMQRLFLTPIGKELLHVASPGGAGRNRTLNQQDMLGLEVRTPGLHEQRRIAGCLTALDNRITAQAAEIAALKEHKRGLMQQLFPAPEEGAA